MKPCLVPVHDLKEALGGGRGGEDAQVEGRHLPGTPRPVEGDAEDGGVADHAQRPSGPARVDHLYLSVHEWL